ncbi:TolC family outer membrane protein [Caldimonas manganoxidans]|uniref:TolC family outer membrane protein n=1 Tax=Caldimonas manganoxidans TaxID=196015 RepID=UPI0003687A20|nr:TolC family outer membrane protein [Caldimonas manganoxidans]
MPLRPRFALACATHRLSRLRPFVLGLSLVWTFPAGAQSLVEIYEAARQYDATYLAARAQAESARFRAAQAGALRLPTVGLGASSTRTEAYPALGPDVSGTAHQLALQARQPLFNRTNAVSIDQADKALDISRADLIQAEQDLIVRVAQAYFDVLAAQDALNTARANKTAIAEQLASARRNFEVGTATITDTREAQARFDLASAQELAAENTLRTRQLALDQLVGRQGVTPKPLATPVVLPSVEPADPEAWVARALDAPAVRRAALAYEIARLETDKARAGHLPTVDLVGSLARNRNNGSLYEAQRTAGNSSTASVGVQFNLPLFAGFAVQNRVKETLSLEEKARNDLEAVRRGVTLGTRQAYLGVLSLQAQVQALEAAEASSKLALEATQTGYRVGVRVNLDVLNAQTQLFSTQRDLARARYDVLLGHLRLRQAAGVLSPDDLASINDLLAR